MVEDLVLVLGEEVGEDVVALFDGAGGGLFLAAEEANQRGFACSVGSDEGDAVAALDGEVEIVKDKFFAACGGGVDLAEAGDLDDGAA